MPSPVVGTTLRPRWILRATLATRIGWFASGLYSYWRTKREKSYFDHHHHHHHCTTIIIISSSIIMYHQHPNYRRHHRRIRRHHHCHHASASSHELSSHAIRIYYILLLKWARKAGYLQYLLLPQAKAKVPFRSCFTGRDRWCFACLDHWMEPWEQEL